MTPTVEMDVLRFDLHRVKDWWPKDPDLVRPTCEVNGARTVFIAQVNKAKIFCRPHHFLCFERVNELSVFNCSDFENLRTKSARTVFIA